MIINKDNIYIKKQEKGKYIVCIEMPDRSRNYLHCEPQNLIDALFTKHDIVGINLDSSIVNFVIDQDYYRIFVVLGYTADHEHSFHSRKMNLNDFTQEYSMLVYP